MTPSSDRSSNWELYWWFLVGLRRWGRRWSSLGGQMLTFSLCRKNGVWYGREVQAVADCGTS